MSRPLLLGHRGARAVRSIPENTLASFDRCLADGCDGFEFDVRLTGDGRAVVYHDPQAGGIEIAQARVQQLTNLPTLENVVARYRHRAVLDIELKVAGLEKTAVDLLRSQPPECGFVVSSFLPDILQAIYATDTALPLGLICETKAQLRAWKRLPVDFVIPHYKLVTQGLIGEIKSVSKKIIVWTVNDPGDMRRFAESGVDGIISDDTSLLCRTLHG